MIRPSRLQNTRIAALISIHEFAVWHLAMRKYIHTDDGRPKQERIQEIYDGTAGLPDDTEARETGITVWENAVASKKLPADYLGARWMRGTNSPKTIRRWPLSVNAAGHSMSINHVEDVPNWNRFFCINGVT